MDSREDYYEILQVSRSAEPEVIEVAYRRLSRKYHPDIDKSLSALKRMQLINKAYEILSDPRKKADYDSKHNKTSDSKKNYQESTHKHSNSKSNTTIRKGNRKIWWGILISAIILFFLYLQNSNKEVSMSGIVTPTMEPMHTIPNTKTGEVKQVPGSQFDYAGANGRYPLN